MTGLRAMLAAGWVAVGCTIAGVRATAARPAQALAHGGASQQPTASVGQVTIQALRDRHALRAAVDHFVFSTLVLFGHDTYPRWDRPICPLVAGLPKNDGDFILARISQAARAAGAPLAGRGCHPDLFVMATSRPKLLLRLWWKRDPNLYNTHDGIAPVWQFIASHRPVHVWYNIALGCGGSPMSTSAPDGSLAAAGVLISGGGTVCGQGVDTLLVNATARKFSSVIVVINKRRVHGMTYGQLAAYIALVGLAQINPDAKVGAVPTILHLFQGVQHPPSGLTAWDRALLYGLYHTNSASTLQVSEINLSVLKKIEQ